MTSISAEIPDKVRRAALSDAQIVHAKVRAIDLVSARRDRQDRQWGMGRILEPFFGMTLVVEELGEAARASLEREGIERVIDEWQDVAATATAIIEGLLLLKMERGS